MMKYYKYISLYILASLGGTAFAQIEYLFPDVDAGKMEQILFKETSVQNLSDGASLVLNTGEQGLEVGLDLPYLTYIHKIALMDARGKVVVDCGAGNGLFSAKLLAAGAKTVLPIELVLSLANNIPNTIANYEADLGKKFAGNYKVYRGDAAKQLALLKKHKPNVFCFFNFFHYQSPTEALNTLKKAYKVAAPGAVLYGVANAWRGTALTTEAYKQARDNGSVFPGYVMQDRLEHLEMVKANGDASLYSKGMQIVHVHPVDAEANISPIHLWNGFYDPSYNYLVSKKQQMEPEYEIMRAFGDGSFIGRKKITRSFFRLDIDSVKRLLKQSGWELVEVGYIINSEPSVFFFEEDITKFREEGASVGFKAIKKSEEAAMEGRYPEEL